MVELLSTEETYVGSLKMLLDVYFQALAKADPPVYAASHSSGWLMLRACRLTKDEVSLIFTNALPLYQVALSFVVPS